MKTITMSFCASLSYKPEFPERTAKRSLSDDVTFKVWPHRKALALTIRMQEKGAPSRMNWIACIPLTDGEGY